MLAYGDKDVCFERTKKAKFPCRSYHFTVLPLLLLFATYFEGIQLCEAMMLAQRKKCILKTHNCGSFVQLLLINVAGSRNYW